MTHLELVPVPPVAQLAGVSQHYGKTVALNNITLDIPARCMVGLIVLIHLKYEKTGRTLDYSGSDGIRFGGACKPVAQILVVNQ
ncbi:TPA: hypothetical protein ACH73J_003463 [Escherichia coli]